MARQWTVGLGPWSGSPVDCWFGPLGVDYWSRRFFNERLLSPPARRALLGERADPLA